MSEFKVKLEKIGEVRAHSNADRLDVARLDGINYSFIVGKDQFRPGDTCVYFPLDAILPEKLLEGLKLKGKLSGAGKDRIKTIKLRGEISAGIVSTLDFAKMYLNREDISFDEDLTEAFGVVKYEPEVNEFTGTPGIRQNPRPELVPGYDIENAERNKNIVEYLLDKVVYVTEKLEGQHASVTVTSDGNLFVCSRNCLLDISEDSTHMRSLATESVIKKVADWLLTKNHRDVTVRGECVGPGIQRNIYKLVKNTFAAFDVMIDGSYVNSADCFRILEEMNIPAVPLIYTGSLRSWLGMSKHTDPCQQIAEISTRRTVYGNSPEQLREGIVIKPEQEETMLRFGRVFIKQRSPEYLASQKD